MNIKIHSIKFDADQKLIDFIEAKLSKLSQIFDNIVGFEVFLRLENSQTSENKITEIRVEIPNNDLFASRQSKTFEESTAQCVDALKVQLVRYKEKLRRNKK
ncbi:MAG: HPF/RaiA family ribosome-associated protein [Salinivirgaceae bacterium]|jgi:putative sigma-54 modulation protein|nr:HPF/RaiA family ribosome-associated protein [Bacteroidota bacterium]NLK15953.1 HPF/RaiA family ribosome-associated protein [Bacteroidales bacterium]